MKVRRKDERGRQAAQSASSKLQVQGSKFEFLRNLCNLRITAPSLASVDGSTGNMARIRVDPTFQSFEELNE
jgi:hypothetical protein